MTISLGSHRSWHSPWRTVCPWAPSSDSSGTACQRTWSGSIPRRRFANGRTSTPPSRTISHRQGWRAGSACQYTSRTNQSMTWDWKIDFWLMLFKSNTQSSKDRLPDVWSGSRCHLWQECGLVAESPAHSGWSLCPPCTWPACGTSRRTRPAPGRWLACTRSSWPTVWSRPRGRTLAN